MDRKSKGQLKCLCEECSVKNKDQSDSEKTSQSLSRTSKSRRGKKTNKENAKANCRGKNKVCNGGEKSTVAENNNFVDSQNGTKGHNLMSHCQSCQSAQESTGKSCEGRREKGGDKQRVRSDHSQDHGYSSEHNNGNGDTPSALSSLASSPEGSEVACSEGFCDHEGERNYKRW